MANKGHKTNKNSIHKVMGKSVKRQMYYKVTQGTVFRKDLSDCLQWSGWKDFEIALIFIMTAKQIIVKITIK